MELFGPFVLMTQLFLTILCDDHLEQSRHMTGFKRDEADGILSKYQCFYQYYLKRSRF